MHSKPDCVRARTVNKSEIIERPSKWPAASWMPPYLLLKCTRCASIACLKVRARKSPLKTLIIHTIICSLTLNKCTFHFNKIHSDFSLDLLVVFNLVLAAVGRSIGAPVKMNLRKGEVVAERPTLQRRRLARILNFHCMQQN